MGKSKINNPFGRFNSRLEDNIMMGLKDKRFKTVDSRGSEGSSGDLL